MKTKTKTDTNETEEQQEDESNDVPPGAEEGQLYTFEDVPLYARVYYMGRLGWVTEKGHGVRQGSGKHIRIQYKETHAGRKESRLHEKLVNKFLRKKKRLWVDFDRQFEVFEDNPYPEDI